MECTPKAIPHEPISMSGWDWKSWKNERECLEEDSKFDPEMDTGRSSELSSHLGCETPKSLWSFRLAQVESLVKSREEKSSCSLLSDCVVSFIHPFYLPQQERILLPLFKNERASIVHDTKLDFG
jgi:hypothetical protein